MFCPICNFCFDSVDSPISDNITICPEDCTFCSYYPPNKDYKILDAFDIPSDFMYE